MIYEKADRLGGTWREVPVFERDDLLPGSRLEGPALIRERHSTTVLEEGWRAVVDPAFAMILSRRTLTHFRWRTDDEVHRATDLPAHLRVPVEPTRGLRIRYVAWRELERYRSSCAPVERARRRVTRWQPHAEVTLAMPQKASNEALHCRENSTSRPA